MHSAVLLFDGELQLRYMNNAAENLLNTSSQRNQQSHASKIFSEDGEIPEGLLKAKNSGQPFSKRSTVLRFPSPEEITVDYTVSPLLNKHGDLLMEIQALDRALKISHDEMLLSSQKVSRQLIQGLAHEIKNPLGGLRGAAQLLERELPSPELKDYTDIIIKEADRLRNLVDQMLGPNNLFNITTINIHEILQHIRKLLRAETHNDMSFEFDYDPSIPEFSGDREQLIQAILNIARNGLESLREANTVQAKLIFRTRIQRQMTIGKYFHRLTLRIDIEDNGPGIRPELRDNLFFPMVTGREQGTGLGLSIAQTIIGQHRGLIKFESEAGKTIFSIYLPLDPQSGIIQ
jgi:two-component system nitrogen regulation sensor histidine kinase GlnL